MLSESMNADLYPEWLQHVESTGTRDAFMFLVGFAATLRELSCHAQFKGVVRDFRFIDLQSEQPFSFIVNKKWLLFYFRMPSVRSRRYDIELLKAAFADVNVNKRGEWTVKLKDVEQARRLTDILKLK